MTAVQEIPTTVQDAITVKDVVPGGDVVLEVVLGVAAPEGEQPVQVTMPHQVWLALGSPQDLTMTLETRCSVCGCTDSQGCFAGCSWATPGLCSRCV